MIRVLNPDEIDVSKWDSCIIHSPNGNIYGLYSSLEAGCKTWKGLVYGDYEAVLALPVKKKLTLKYSWHPQFMGPLGIYGLSVSPEIATGFYTSMMEGSWWIRMYYFQKPGATKCKFTPRVYQVLDVSILDRQNLKKIYNDNTRRNLKKASQLELAVRRSENVDQFVNLFKKNKGDEIDSLKDSSYQQLYTLIDHWMKNGHAYIQALYQNEELLGMACFIKWNKTLTFYKGFSTEKGKQNGAMHFLLNNEIEASLGEVDHVDFGGSNVPSVARFYKGFGGTDKEYYFLEYRKF